MTLCACGCGKALPEESAEKGIKYLNRSHYAKYREKMRKEKGYYVSLKKKSNPTDRKIHYEKGKDFCRNYDNYNIKCVMCIENNFNRPNKCPKEV